MQWKGIKIRRGRNPFRPLLPYYYHIKNNWTEQFLSCNQKGTPFYKECLSVE